jgi:uroporphyrinogen-III decarboxylase
MNIALFPVEINKLLDTITEFICQWLILQKEKFPSIDGIFILDDLVGFIGEDDFKTFALPALHKIFHSYDATVRFFHNDAHGLICSKYLKQMGINLFNFSFEHPVDEIRALAGPDAVLLGNLAPRDVLGAADPATVIRETENLYHSVTHKQNMIWSGGGGLPPGVPAENLKAFIDTITRISVH